MADGDAPFFFGATQPLARQRTKAFFRVVWSGPLKDMLPVFTTLVELLPVASIVLKFVCSEQVRELLAPYHFFLCVGTVNLELIGSLP